MNRKNEGKTGIGYEDMQHVCCRRGICSSLSGVRATATLAACLTITLMVSGARCAPISAIGQQAWPHKRYSRASFVRPVVPRLPQSHQAAASARVRSCISPTRRRRGVQLQAVDVSLAVYNMELWAKDLVDTQLTHLTPVSGAILYFGGLLTSLSPCALSLVPLTMAYLSDDGIDPEKSRQTLLFRAAAFTVGLALALSLLGLSATLAGRLFGSGPDMVGPILPLTASLIAMAMGFNLLELLPLRLPSYEAALPLEGMSPALQAFLLGATSALIATPCSTPVLASILGFVATSRDLTLGTGLLFAYSLGYATPVLVAGTVSGAVTSFVSQRGDGFSWVTPATGALLIAWGTYSGMNVLLDL